MFIVYLPYKNYFVELHHKKGVPYVFDSKTDTYLNLTKNTPHSSYWLGSLVSRNWDKIKLSSKEKEAIAIAIKVLKS